MTFTYQGVRNISFSENFAYVWICMMLFLDVFWECLKVALAWNGNKRLFIYKFKHCSTELTNFIEFILMLLKINKESVMFFKHGKRIKGTHQHSHCHTKRNFDVFLLTHPPTSENVKPWTQKNYQNAKIH